jgi:hypothetical protein
MADPAPIVLGVASELSGRWFVPGREENAASGRLLFDPVDGLTLETVSDLPLLGTGNEPEPFVLGITVDGRLVTLRRVFGVQQRWNSLGGVWALTAHANTAFIGMHATSERELRFHVMQARLTHLNEWSYTTGIDLDHAVFPKGGTMEFAVPSPIVLASHRGDGLALVRVRGGAVSRKG